MHIIEFFHLHIILMTLFKDIMPYFDFEINTCLWLKSEYIIGKNIHSCMYGYILSIFWFPLKKRMPQNYTRANFEHPVSKSWLIPCMLWTQRVEIQGLSQELENGCLKLAIVKFLGVQIFKGDHNILRFQPLTCLYLSK